MARGCPDTGSGGTASSDTDQTSYRISQPTRPSDYDNYIPVCKESQQWARRNCGNVSNDQGTAQDVLTYDGGIGEVGSVWSDRAVDAGGIAVDTGKSVVHDATVEGPRRAYDIIKSWFSRD